MAKRLKNSRYITGFDGIRTLAVVGVIFYHLFPYNMVGGYLGVPIFFVVSGYLITDLLLQEYDQNGMIDLKAFYIRRMKRLYPALVTMVITTAAFITLFARDLLNKLGSIILTNLFYIYNWFQVSNHESYFDKFGTQSPFTHLWSLSIEGQFYLFWPLVLVLLLFIFRSHQPILDLVLILAFVSVLTMMFLFHPGQDPSRVYYGTDTRLFSILVGVSLAFIWPSTRLKRHLETLPRTLLDVIGFVALCLTIFFFFKLDGESDLVYYGGMFFFSLVSAILIAVIAHPGADINQLMTNPLFTWIGKRSYGIYLYQIPVMVFYEAKVPHLANHPWLHALIEISLILIISDLSYRYLERPLQHFNYGRLLNVCKEFFSKNSTYGWKRLGPLVAFLLICIASWGAIAQPKASATKQDSTTLQKVIKQNEKNAKKRPQPPKEQSSTSSASSSDSSQTKHNSTQLTGKEIRQAQKLKVTAVGDSVLADTSGNLQQIFPKIDVNGKVGRQVRDAIPILQDLAQKGQLPQTVLLALGTNGPFSKQEMQQIMQTIGPKRQVYWVNVVVPTQRWEGPVNHDLQQAQKKYSNLTVIDWYAYSHKHANWFYSDQVHPNENGVSYFGNFVAKKILKK